MTTPIFINGHGPQYLYRHYGNGDLLYTGITNNMARRTLQHSKDKPWFSRVDYIVAESAPNRTTVLAQESASIKGEIPFFNRAGNPYPVPKQLLTPSSLRVMFFTLDFTVSTLVLWLLPKYERVMVRAGMRIHEEADRRIGVYFLGFELQETPALPSGEEKKENALVYNKIRHLVIYGIRGVALAALPMVLTPGMPFTAVLVTAIRARKFHVMISSGAFAIITVRSVHKGYRLRAAARRTKIKLRRAGRRATRMLPRGS